MNAKTDVVLKRRLRSSYITTTISLVMVLLVLGIFGLILLSFDRISTHFKENLEIDIFLKENIKQVDIAYLKKELEAAEYVKSAQYVSQEEAAKILRQELDPQEDFLSLLGYNPLKPSINLVLHESYVNQDSINKIRTAILKNAFVSDFHYDSFIVDRMNKVIRWTGIGLLGLIGILFVISFVLINNTVRLSLFSRRFIIRTMKLVGATSSYIRLPFLLRSTWIGLLSAFIASIPIMGALYKLVEYEPHFLKELQYFVMLFGFIFIIGVLFAYITTYFAMSKFLRMNEDDLYQY